MPFPFSLTQTIILDQSRYEITSEGYLFHIVEARLDYLDMDVSRLNENEMFLRKPELVRTFRQKDLLRNLLVRIELDASHIYIKLKTETILIFLFGLFPLIIGLLGAMPLPGGVGCAAFFWTIGFLSKLMILSSVKNKLEYSLQKL